MHIFFLVLLLLQVPVRSLPILPRLMLTPVPVVQILPGKPG